MKKSDIDMRRVLVTGATGFIGSRLVAKLIKNNLEIGAVHRKSSAHYDNGVFASGKVRKVCADFRELSTLAGICTGYDTVFHLAGYAHADDAADSRSDSVHWSVTYEGTRVLLNEAKKSGVKRFIFISSVKVFGEGTTECLTENTESKPTTGYGKAKLAAEKLVLESPENNRMHTVVLRLPLVYGRQNKGNIPRMISAIDSGRFPPLLNIRNKRSMVHVDDVIQALLLAATTIRANKNAYIVTDGKLYSTSDLYFAICHSLGKRIPGWSMPLWLLKLGAIAGDIIEKFIGRDVGLNSAMLDKILGSACYLSIKIQNELGYKPNHSLFGELPDMIQEYKSQIIRN